VRGISGLNECRRSSALFCAPRREEYAATKFAGLAIKWPFCRQQVILAPTLLPFPASPLPSSGRYLSHRPRGRPLPRPRTSHTRRCRHPSPGQSHTAYEERMGRPLKDIAGHVRDTVWCVAKAEAFPAVGISAAISPQATTATGMILLMPASLRYRPAARPAPLAQRRRQRHTALWWPSAKRACRVGSGGRQNGGATSRPGRAAV
jgi:hypothetical protein